MAHLISCNAIPKLAQLGAGVTKNGGWGGVALLNAGRRSIQSGPASGPASPNPLGQAKEAAKQGAEELIQGGENIVNKATNAVDNTANQKATYVADNTAATSKHVSETLHEGANSMADDAAGTAQEVSNKARQAVRDVWGSAKETAQKAKDNVLGKDS